MSSPNKNWYSHLVAQSRTNDIYNLIHLYLMPDWEPGHALDFVVVRRKNLPDHLKTIPQKHYSKKLLPKNYCFPGNDHILLHNYQLTEYLHAAKWAECIEDFEDRSFIELHFETTEKSWAIANDPPAYRMGKQPVSYTDAEPTAAQLQPPVNEEENALLLAYELLQSGAQKEKALYYAERGWAFLDTHPVMADENSDMVVQQVARRMMGYNIVAMVYVWNNQINKAASVDQLYIHHPPMWKTLAVYIKPYLEMLMIKNQQDYLQHLFSDKEFRRFFLSHYEAFISLFVNPKYELTRMGEVINIINRVNNDVMYK